MELLDDVRKREDTGKWNTKHLIAPCGTLALEEAVDRRKTLWDEPPSYVGRILPACQKTPINLLAPEFGI